MPATDALNKKHAVVLGDHTEPVDPMRREPSANSWIFHDRPWGYPWSRWLVGCLSGIWDANSLIVHVA